MESIREFAQNSLTPLEQDVLFGNLLEPSRKKRVSMIAVCKQLRCDSSIPFKESIIAKVKKHLLSIGIKSWDDLT